MRVILEIIPCKYIDWVVCVFSVGNQNKLMSSRLRTIWGVEEGGGGGKSWVAQRRVGPGKGGKSPKIWGNKRSGTDSDFREVS